MAKFISPKTLPGELGLYKFKKKIIISECENSEIRIYASTRYILYINGEYISEGPCRGHEDVWYFDTVTTDKLRKGENEITVKVMHETHLSHFTSVFKSFKPMLIMDIKTGEEYFSTDCSWECLFLKNHRLIYHGFCFVAPFEEYINDESVSLGTEETYKYDFDKGMGFTYGKIEPHTILPRPIPMIYPGESVSLTPVKKGEGFIEYDSGKYITAKLKFDIAKNSHVKIIYSECYESENGKGQRDDLSGFLKGFHDIVHPQENDFTFIPYWFRAFRYIRIEADNPEEAVKSIEVKKCHYPLAIESSFECSDKNLNLMNEISINTMLCCTHEIFVDCPFYEQQQYIMDSAIEAAVLMRMSSDTRIIKKCIEEFAASQHPTGLLSANYPCSHTQIIPGFSFFWVYLLKDYLEYSNDISFAKKFIGTIEKIFNYFENSLNDKGLISVSDSWDFVDWVPHWWAGVPALKKGEALTIYNLYYACALKSAESICNILGKKYLAEEYKKRHSKLSEKLFKECYDSEKALFKDGSDTREFSMHTIIWSILAEIVTGDAAKESIKHLFDEDILKSSFSMNFYLFRALEKADCYSFAFDFLKGWQDMIDMHCTTWCENPDSPRSECHGWSSAPLYEFSANILGVKYSGDDFITISPFVGNLSFAKGAVPTRFGKVTVEWEICGDFFKLKTETPKDVSKKIILPNGEVIISNTSNDILECKMR